MSLNIASTENVPFPPYYLQAPVSKPSRPLTSAVASLSTKRRRNSSSASAVPLTPSATANMQRCRNTRLQSAVRLPRRHNANGQHKRRRLFLVSLPRRQPRPAANSVRRSAICCAAVRHRSTPSVDNMSRRRHASHRGNSRRQSAKASPKIARMCLLITLCKLK